MKKWWLDTSLLLCKDTDGFQCGARKIIRGRDIVMQGDLISTGKNLSVEDCGYTKMKLTRLKKLYYQEESIETAMDLWLRRKEKRKYGSVGFTNYNHLIKTDPDKTSKRGSIMGPCIQSVVLTWVSPGYTYIDIFYRTTEFFKKFPADLIFIRDYLLSNFSFKDCPIKSTTFHFANITCHPMYFITLFPFMSNIPKELNTIRFRDNKFWMNIIRWSSNYLCEEHLVSIKKFSQAMRVQGDAIKRIDPQVINDLQIYLRKHRPPKKGLR